MELKYQINDTRTPDRFKKSTFGGYKKGDTLSEFIKACETNKLENALFWLTEIHCSHYIDELFEKIFIFISTKVHLNSFQLPLIIWNHFLFWQSQEINTNTVNTVNTVNNQKVRNSLFETVALLIQCEKHRILPKKKTIKDVDFNITKLTTMITCSTNHISPNIIKTKDPKVLTIVFNEFSYCITRHQDLQGKIQDKKLKEREDYMDKAIYWLCWIHKWETNQRKKGGTADCSSRSVTGISDEDSCDIIWICWSVILAECKRRVSDNCISQVAALYNMYKHRFTRSKKASKMPIIIHALALLILDNAPPTKTILTNPLTIQAVMKCNLLYQNMKQFEVRVHLPPADLMQVQPAATGRQVKDKKSKGKKETHSIKTIESMNKMDLVMKIDMDRQNH